VPEIHAHVPSGGKVSVGAGETLDFSVRAKDPDTDDRLAYAWYLDGDPVGHASRWAFKAPSAVEGRKVFQVEAEVSDQAGLRPERVRWSVEVTAAPPRIVESEPRAPEVMLTAGQTRTFSARAAGGEGDAPRYEWTLDGRPAPGGAEGRLELPASLAAGRHTLEVVAVDARAGRSAPRRWVLDVKAATGISEADVREWLARYRAAYEQKDVAALRRLGVVANEDEAGRVARVLEGFGALSVALRNETIQNEGGTATVSFERTDTDVDTGKKLVHPQRLSFRLERGPGGVVAVRR
jgi:hypothetical protein